MTQQSTGSQLLLYAGPVFDSDAATVPDFISLELVNGFPKLRINLGDGELKLPATDVTSSSLADGNWHTVEIFRTAKVN
jgi:hypothetical protein